MTVYLLRLSLFVLVGFETMIFLFYLFSIFYGILTMQYKVNVIKWKQWKVMNWIEMKKRTEWKQGNQNKILLRAKG